MQAYLKALLAACNAAERRPRQNGAAAAPGPAAGAPSLATPRVAVRCLAMLLTSLSHFNHASDVLQVSIPCIRPYLGCFALKYYAMG